MDIIPEPSQQYFDDLPVYATIVNGADKIAWQKSPTLNWGNIFGDRRSSLSLIETYDPEEPWFQLMPAMVIEDETPIVDDTLPEEQPAPEVESIPTWEVQDSEPELDSGGNIVTLRSQSEEPQA